MKNQLLKIGLSVLLVVAFPTFADDVPDWAYDAILGPWYEAYNAHDAAGIASQYTQNAVTGNGTGRAAIEAQLRSAWADEDIQCHGDFDGFRQIGDEAVGWGLDICSATSKSDGAIRTIRTEWLAYYERQPDGSWQASRDFGEEVRYLEGFMPAQGVWAVEEQQRPTPDSDWIGATSEWGIIPTHGNRFIDTSGSRTFDGGETITWTEIWGVNPASQEPFFGFVDSSGATGQGTYKWVGRTWTSEANMASPDVSQMATSCSLTFNASYTEFDGSCNASADGQIWQMYKGKGVRQK